VRNTFANAAPWPYDEQADAAGDVQHALSAAQVDHKQVLLVFGANWCPDCRALDKAMHGSSRHLIDSHFEVVKIDVRNFDKNLYLAKRYGNPIAAGIPAIGVWRQKLADFGEEKGIELLADSGLSVSNLLWAGGFTGSDGHTYRESLNDAAEAIRLAAALNALVTDPGRAAAMGRAGRGRAVAEFSWAQIAGLTAQLYATLAVPALAAS